MFCPYCGAQIPEDSVFCERCGRKQPVLDASETLPAAEPAPAPEPVIDREPLPEPIREEPMPQSEKPPRASGKPGNPMVGAAIGTVLLLLSGVAGYDQIIRYGRAWVFRTSAIIYAIGVLASIGLLFALAAKKRLREVSIPGYVLLGAARAVLNFLTAVLLTAVLITRSVRLIWPFREIMIGIDLGLSIVSVGITWLMYRKSKGR